MCTINLILFSFMAELLNKNAKYFIVFYFCYLTTINYCHIDDISFFPTLQVCFVYNTFVQTTSQINRSALIKTYKLKKTKEMTTKRNKLFIHVPVVRSCLSFDFKLSFSASVSMTTGCAFIFLQFSWNRFDIILYHETVQCYR